MDELCEEFLIQNDDTIIMYLLDFIKKIICYDNCNTFYPIIINILLKKLKWIIDSRQYTNVDINKLSRDKKLDYIFKSCPNAKLNLFILNESMEIFKRMSTVNAKDFIEYLPLILTIFKDTNILFYSDYKQQFKNSFLDVHDYALKNKKEFLNRICGENCTINSIIYNEKTIICSCDFSDSINDLSISTSNQIIRTNNFEGKINKNIYK